MEKERELDITLHALPSWMTPSTMRIKIKLKNQEFISLIDSGSTHNFINDHLVKIL